MAKSIATRQSSMREILLVEDSGDDALFLERLLKGAGVVNPIRHISDGSAALAFLQDRENSAPIAQSDIPAVLLLDLKLPGAAGFAILGYLQGAPALSDMLRVVVSDLNLQDLRTVYSMGAHSFLPKPVKADDLKNLIVTYPEYWCRK